MVASVANMIFEVSLCKYLNLNEDYDNVITTIYRYDVEGWFSVERDNLHDLAKQVVSACHMNYFIKHNHAQPETEPIDLAGFFGIKFIEKRGALEYTCDGFRSKEPLPEGEETKFMNYLMRVCKNYREGKYEICEPDFTLKLK